VAQVKVVRLTLAGVFGPMVVAPRLALALVAVVASVQVGAVSLSPLSRVTAGGTWVIQLTSP